jgi:hypothetical protein
MASLLNPYHHHTGSQGPARWFRGNIHTHTTASDGRQDPQEVIDWYAGRGYDFLSITDHNLALELSGLDPRGMLLVRGEELTAPGTHVVGIGIDGTLPAGTATQEQIDLVRSSGGLAIVCHPNWMGLTPEDIEPLRGHLAIELSNQVCYRLNGKGDSVAWWDTLLSRGRRCWGAAVDDCHDLPQDACGGWLNVLAAERTWPALKAALEGGSFVASTGPGVERIHVGGRTIAVETSDAAEIRLVGQNARVLSVCTGTASEPLRKAAFDVADDEPFARLEICDLNGRRAWSQPFWSA